MKLELELEEAQEIFTVIVDRLLEEASLNAGDRATLSRWRSEGMKAGSDGMRALAARINSDIDRALQNKAKSAIQKPDWR